MTVDIPDLVCPHVLKLRTVPLCLVWYPKSPAAQADSLCSVSLPWNPVILSSWITGPFASCLGFLGSQCTPLLHTHTHMPAHTQALTHAHTPLNSTQEPNFLDFYFPNAVPSITLSPSLYLHAPSLPLPPAPPFPSEQAGPYFW